MTPGPDEPPGQRLRNRRVAHTLSQMEVAEAAGITHQRLHDIEWGRGAQPSPEEIQRIETAIDNLPLEQ